MSRKSKGKTIALVVLSALFFAVAVVGNFQKSEGLLATGITLGALCLLLIPALRKVDQRAARYQSGEPLIRWEYSDQEVDTAAQQIIRSNFKRRRGFAVTIFVLLCLLFVPFIFILSDQIPDLPKLVLVLLGLLPVIPWIVLLLSFPVLRSRIRRSPTRTEIYRNGLIVGNTVPYLNNREELQLTAATFRPAAEGLSELELTYKSAVRYKSTGLSWGRDIICVPIPRGAEESAKAFANSLLKKN